MCLERFKGDVKFTESLDKAFKDIVNCKDSSGSSETLAKFVDMLLKKKAVGKESEGDVDEKLNYVVIFSYG